MDFARGVRIGAAGSWRTHVLELMYAFHEASDSASHVMIESHVERPAALPMGLLVGMLDD